MVTTLKKFDLPKQPAADARFTRRTPSQKRFENQKPLLRYKRARYYSAQFGRFISRDPLGFVDGMSLYRAYFVPNSMDPSGAVVIRCLCKGEAGYNHYVPAVWKEIDCTGGHSSCCNQACGGKWSGGWKIVPGRDAWDDAQDDIRNGVVEIVLCCIPVGGGVAVVGATRTCVRGAIVFTRKGHAVLRLTHKGKTIWRHMPGQKWVGKPITKRGIDNYLDDVRWWKIVGDFPIRNPRATLSTKCSPNCVWTVVRAIARGTFK